ncbi:MAG: helix-turn-helix domain-containing protein [Vicinamibacterales bacterium]
MTRTVNISTGARGRANRAGATATVTAHRSVAGAGDTEVLATISARVRARRRARQLSLDQLCARSGVSKGMLVQIERGATNPSIGTLCKVAAALGASVADLVDAAGPARADVVPAAAPRTLWTGPKGGFASLLVGSTGPDMLELWTWELRPGERYDAPAHPPGTQELLHVERGRLALVFGRVSYVVDAGRSARAFTDRPHAYACAGARPVRFTMAVAEWHTSRATSGRSHGRSAAV